MKSIQRPATIVLLTTQCVLSLVFLLYPRLFWNPAFFADYQALFGGAAVVSGGLLLLFLQGWPVASDLALLGFASFLAVTLPPPYVSEQVSLSLLIPPALALLICRPASIALAMILPFGILIARAGGGVHSEPGVLLIMTAVVGTCVVTRLRYDQALRQVAAEREGIQKHAETLEQQNRALQRSEERFANMFTFSPVATAINAIPDGRYVDANQRFCDLIGFTREELIGRTPLDIQFWPPDPRNKQIETMIRAGETLHSVELSLRTANGEIRPGIASIDYIEIDGQQCIIGIVYEINDHQHTAKIRELERQCFVQLANNTPLPLIFEQLILTVETQIPLSQCTIHLLDASREWLLLGAAPSMPPDYIARSQRIAVGRTTAWCSTAILTNDIVIVEDIAASDYRDDCLFLTTDYNLRSCWALPIHDAFGTPIGTFAVYCQFPRRPSAADIGILTTAAHLVMVAVDHDRVEVELQRSERRLRALFDHAVDMVMILDEQGDIRYANPAVSAALGLPIEAVLHTSSFAYVDPNEREFLLQALAELVLTPNGTRFIPAVRLRHANGSWFVIEMLASNALDDPAVDGVVVNCRNITERRNLEAQLFQAQKLESLGRLAGGIAHDFNNIMTAITGYSDIAQLAITSGDPIGNELHEIQLAARRATLLTRQLLAFARQQRIEPQVLDFNTLLTDLERMLRRLISAAIEFTMSLDAAVLPVCVDPGRLEQVLVNLVVNAADAMPNGGRLILATRMVMLDADETSQRPPLVPGQHIMLTIRDTGTGMASAVQERLFDPFFTTKERGRGSGLGLAIVHGIIQQHHGSIEFDSELGQGTVFTVLLPCAALPIHIPLPANEPTPAPRGSEFVLLVEDEAPVRDLAARILRAQGYTVLTADNGREALAVAATLPQPIDLLLTDLVMPHLGGYDLATALLETMPTLRVLFMSGYAGRVLPTDFTESSHMRFLQKPFSAALIAHTVREVLDAVEQV